MNKGIALFGGSFNPPTNAHLGIIREASRRFSRVVVMPAAISPFKLDAKRISVNDRLHLLEEICRPFAAAEVSDYEIRQSGVSYTYKTVEYLRKTCQTDIYLIIGSDNIKRLGEWKYFDKIASAVTFYIVPRPYFPLGEEEKSVLIKLGCKYEEADFAGETGSSTIVPLARAFGKLAQVVPPRVEEYIVARDLFSSLQYVRGIYDRFSVKPERREHIYRTAVAAASLASIYGADSEKTITAAVLHDVGKYVTVREMEEKGFRFDEEARHCPAPVEHCYTSEAIARDVAGIDDPEVLRAIRLHTTGDRDMTTLQKIIFCADYIEEGRTTPGVEKIRCDIVKNLDVAMLEIVESTVGYLEKKGAAVDRRTVECRKWLKEIILKGE